MNKTVNLQLSTFQLSPAERDALDARAMRRIQQGDATGLGELYDRYAPLALSLALKIVHEPVEAEDIVQDAFIAVVERADQFRPERGTAIAWFVTIVRNLALDRARRRIRRAQITDLELRYEPVEAVRDPEELVWQESERRSVVKALQGLSQSQRETLEIAFFEGLSYPEIAERDGVALGTVKSRAARALAELRRALQADLSGEDSREP